MKVIWQLERVTVRDVYEELLKRRKIAYTTVMTMMGILEEKGYLNRTQGERAYIYEPAQPKAQVLRGMVREFLDRVFNGAAKPLLVHLIENRQLTPEELDEIAQLMKESRRKKR